MSAMDDIHIPLPRPAEPFSGGLRDFALALCVTILASLALSASEMTGPAAGNPAMGVVDWKGNSGNLPAAR